MTRSGALTLGVTEAPSEAEVALIEDGLTAYNAAFGATAARRPLSVLVRDGAGAALGGATGYTDRGWLYLDCFWLPESLRQGGWGSRVLAAAEAEGLRRGCRGARLFTYSFQARGFYEKHGYTVFGILDDFPPGHSQIWLRKTLAG